MSLKGADRQQGFLAASLMSGTFFSFLLNKKQKDAADWRRTVPLAAVSAVFLNYFLIERSLKLHSKAFLSLQLDLVKHPGQLTSNILGGPRAGQALQMLPLTLCLHRHCPVSAL